jgi:hypothetical protein
MKRCIVAGLGVVMLAACGGSASETPPPPSVDITGSWTGVVTQPSSAFRLWLRANQSTGGAHVEATYVTDFYATGNVTGAVEGDLFRFTVVVTNPGCPGELTGSARVETATVPATMALSYSGSTSCGGAESGEVVLRREGEGPPR